MNEFLTWLLDTVQSVDPVVRTLLAGLAIMLETSVLIGLFVPGDTIVIIAATAVASPLEGVLLGVAVVIGALIGESIGFWLGRFLGPRIHQSALGRRIGEENWARSERYLRRRGGPAIFISRFLPVLHSLVPLTVGMSGYPYRRFLAWTAPACVIWAALYITVGVPRGRHIPRARRSAALRRLHLRRRSSSSSSHSSSSARRSSSAPSASTSTAADEDRPDPLPSQGSIQDDVKD